MDPALAPPPVDAGIFTAVDTPPSILPVTSFSADFTLRPSTTCGHPDDTALTIPLSVVNLSAAAAKRQVRDIEAQVLPVDPSLDGSESKACPLASGNFSVTLHPIYSGAGDRARGLLGCLMPPAFVALDVFSFPITQLVHRTMTMLGDFLASLGVLISFSTVSASDSPGRATVPASAAPQGLYHPAGRLARLLMRTTIMQKI